MSTPIRNTASVLAVLMLVATGCGGNGEAGKAEPGSELEDQRAAMISEFERAVEEARFLRDDIAALRDDMRAGREAADDEIESASRDTASLREEIASMRREMVELSDAAASEAERSAQEARSLREEITVIRDDMSAVREAAENAESLAGDFSDIRSQVDEYPEPLVYEDEIRSRQNWMRRRPMSPVSGMYAPLYRPWQVTPYPRNTRREGRRQSRSRDAQENASRVTGGAPTTITSNPTPEAPSAPSISNPSPVAPSRPAVSTPRPSAPASRPSAPASRSVSRPAGVPTKPVHIPVRER